MLLVVPGPLFLQANGVDVVGMQRVAGGPFTWGHTPRYSHAMAQREAVTESAEMRFQLAEEKHHGKRDTAFGGAETEVDIIYISCWHIFLCIYVSI